MFRSCMMIKCKQYLRVCNNQVHERRIISGVLLPVPHSGIRSHITFYKLLTLTLPFHCKVYSSKTEIDLTLKVKHAGDCFYVYNPLNRNC